MPDQAELLRQLVKEQMNYTTPHKTKLIAVASGKGGVGKTSLVLNYALALAKVGKKVAVFDGDFGFSNIDILLGLRTAHSLQDVMDGKTSLKTALTQGPNGLSFVSGGAGMPSNETRSHMAVSRFAKELHSLDGEFDSIFIDFGAGFGVITSEMMRLCDELLLVVTPENTSLADAYALLKMMSLNGSTPLVQLIINRTPTYAVGSFTADKFIQVVQKFLHIDIHILGYVLEDAAVSRAINKQIPFIIGEPHSQASKCVQKLTVNSLSQDITEQDDHGVKAFFKRFLNWKQ